MILPKVTVTKYILSDAASSVAINAEGFTEEFSRLALVRGSQVMPTSSDISSVIALEKVENGRERAKADERIRKRQILGFVRVPLKRPVFIEVSESADKDSLPPSQIPLNLLNS